MKTVDLTGERFGKLVAVRPTEKRQKGSNSVLWECNCDCGNTTYVSTGDLRGGNTRSCGCLRQSLLKDLTGQRFGKLTVVRKTEQRKYGVRLWECVCDCGNASFVSSFNLKSGRTTSCGCSRRGKGRGMSPSNNSLEKVAVENIDYDYDFSGLRNNEKDDNDDLRGTFSGRTNG